MQGFLDACLLKPHAMGYSKMRYIQIRAAMPYVQYEIIELEEYAHSKLRHVVKLALQSAYRFQL